jgi:drug/metabolite transporter (DMT)-like permease
MQIVKAAEPVVSVLTLTLLYGQRFSTGVWLSLIPIVAGVGVVSATEVNFAWAGFVAAMISNFAFVFRNIKSKEAQSDIGLQGINLCVVRRMSFVCVCLLCLLTCGPLACFVGRPGTRGCPFWAPLCCCPSRC